MNLNYDTILNRANELYVEAKVLPGSLPYLAPELRPKISSDQVKCILRAIVEELNKQPTPPTQ